MKNKNNITLNIKQCLECPFSNTLCGAPHCIFDLVNPIPFKYKHPQHKSYCCPPKPPRWCPLKKNNVNIILNEDKTTDSTDKQLNYHYLQEIGEEKPYLTEKIEPTKNDANKDGKVQAWNQKTKLWEDRFWFDFQSHPEWTNEEKIIIKQLYPVWRKYKEIL